MLQQEEGLYRRHHSGSTRGGVIQGTPQWLNKIRFIQGTPQWFNKRRGYTGDTTVVQQNEGLYRGHHSGSTGEGVIKGTPKWFNRRRGYTRDSSKG